MNLSSVFSCHIYPGLNSLKTIDLGLFLKFYAPLRDVKGPKSMITSFFAMCFFSIMFDLAITSFNTNLTFI